MDAPKVATTKRGKKSKRLDKRPARSKYWMKRTLEQKKIRNLMRCCGMTRAQAMKTWHEGALSKKGKLYGKRQGRVPDKYLRAV
jgi:hypothetical protein